MATSGIERPSLASLCNADVISNSKFDYVIVGGGTAGLVLANRLTENPAIHVAVIEAGAANIEDPNILTPALFSTVISNEKYDWMMKTVPQAGHHGKVHQFPRGKSLGGSTAINFMMYARGQKQEYDDWAALGNPGWGWDDMLPYFRKTQQFEDPKSFNISTKVAYEESNHGRQGPIHTSFASYRVPAENDWFDSATAIADKAGIVYPQDAFGGNHLGFFNSLLTIDRTDNVGTRSYATTGYFLPAAQRPNLKVLTEALVTKIVLEKSEGSVVARGVELSVDGGKAVHIVYATREVISCAGVVKTPQLLELSGIGDPRILAAAGVTTIVSNPAVGDNLQDHIVTGITYALDDKDFSMDRLQNPEDLQAAMAEYTSTHDGPLTVTIGGMGFMPYSRLVSPDELERVVGEAEKANQSGKSEYSKKRREIQLKRLGEKDTASLQIVLLPANGNCSRGDDQHGFLGPPPAGKVHIAQGIALQFPLSHGSIHIRTASALDQPDIDPSYLADPADVSLLVKGLQFADRINKEQPLAGRLRERVFPASHVDIQDDVACEAYLRDFSLTEYHPVGTAAMGEVVDEHLRVIGVRGLRVVDASIMPMHVSGNIVSTVYAIAEKAADIIKAQNV